MPHFSERRYIEANDIFCLRRTSSLLRALFPVNLQSSLLEHSHLISAFKWRILIRVMPKTLLKIVAYNNRCGHHLSKYVTLID